MRHPDKRFSGCAGLHLSMWGEVDPKSDTIDMWLGIPAASLSQLGIRGYSRAAMLPIRVQGSLQAPSQPVTKPGHQEMGGGSHPAALPLSDITPHILLTSVTYPMLCFDEVASQPEVALHKEVSIFLGTEGLCDGLASRPHFYGTVLLQRIQEGCVPGRQPRRPTQRPVCSTLSRLCAASDWRGSSLGPQQHRRAARADASAASFAAAWRQLGRHCDAVRGCPEYTAGEEATRAVTV